VAAHRGSSNSSSSLKRHRRRHHVARHRRIEPGAVARTALIGTAGAVAIGAAFGIGNVGEVPSHVPSSGTALDSVLHQRGDQPTARGGIGRAPVTGPATSLGQPAAASPAPAQPAQALVAAPGVPPPGCEAYQGNRLLACTLLPEAGFGLDQMPALDNLWTRESGWNHLAENPHSGAYGIPQSLPGDKMATHGDDWRTNPATQIRWGLDYIKNRYGSPDAAWAFFLNNGWY
jgi:hypothetical protein